MSDKIDFDAFPAFNNAAACRAKAASMRAAAQEAVSEQLARAYTQIALKWDEIAADYDGTPLPYKSCCCTVGAELVPLERRPSLTSFKARV